MKSLMKRSIFDLEREDRLINCIPQEYSSCDFLTTRTISPCVLIKVFPIKKEHVALSPFDSSLSVLKRMPELLILFEFAKKKSYLNCGP
jgi:hypothetical protein